MALINHHLLRKEIKNWGTLKRMYSRQVHSFGSYMNKKYHFNNDKLVETISSISAIRIILERHVKY